MAKAKVEKIPAEKTAYFYRNILGVFITNEEAEAASERIAELFFLLDKWGKKRSLPPCAAYWLLDDEDKYKCK